MRAGVDTAAPTQLTDIVRRLAANEAVCGEGPMRPAGSEIRSARPDGSIANTDTRLTSSAAADLTADELLQAVIVATGADGGAMIYLGIQPPAEAGVPGPHAALRILAVHPRQADSDGHATVPPWLRRIAPAIPAITTEGRAVVLPVRDPATLYGQSHAGHAVVMPVPGEAGAGFFVALFLARKNREEVDPCRHHLELCSGVLAWFFTQTERQQTRVLAVAMSVLASVGEQPRFRTAAIALCQEVATRWRASRVTLGICSGRYVKARAMSRTEQLNRKTKLVQAIESAMEECADQDAEVRYPHGDQTTTVCRAARELSVNFGRHHVLSMPLRLQHAHGADRGLLPEGVLTVEVSSVDEGDPSAALITAEAIETLRLTCNLLAPLLLKLYDTDRWIGAKIAREAGHAVAWAVGPKHTWAKVAAIAGCALLAFATLYPAPHRVASPFLLQPGERQLIVAPFDGYLQAVHVVPGDEVIVAEAGVLAELNTVERRLQLAERQADLAQFLKQADVARRDGKTADMQIAQAEAERVAAEIALLEHQIRQAVLRSPLAGVVLEGDHQRRVGGSVNKGEVLFEIAPPPPAVCV